jgi:hypothetical protein
VEKTRHTILGMKRVRFLILSLFTVMTVGTTAADEAWLVRAGGAGRIRIGMTLAQLNAALGEKFVAPVGQDQVDCFYLTMSKPPKLRLMMLEGRLGRIDVREAGVKTVSGIQVGDTEAQARKVYGARLKVEPRKYVEDGHYLTVKSNDGRRGIRFQTSGGKITSYYAGRDQAIQLVEGCQ